MQLRDLWVLIRSHEQPQAGIRVGGTADSARGFCGPNPAFGSASANGVKRG